MRTLLLTRPAADSKQLADALQSKSISSILSPVITINPRDVHIEGDGFDGIILTSRHAIASVQMRDEPCYVVGEHTAAIAQASGLIVHTLCETASELATQLEPYKRYLYPSGADIRSDFTDTDAQIVRVVVYSADAADALSPDAIAALKADALEAVVFYSPRSAVIFCQLVQSSQLAKHIDRLHAYCLSEAVAEQCSGLYWQQIHVAEAPHKQAMWQLLCAANKTLAKP